MKAKTYITANRHSRNGEPVPHELGRHLFALIKRNLIARRGKQQPAPRASQLTFAF